MSCALVVDLEKTRWTRTGCGPQGFTSSRDLGTQTSHGEHKTGHHRSMARGLMKHSPGICSTEGSGPSFSTPAQLQTWGTRTRAFTPGCDEAARAQGKTPTRNLTARGGTQNSSETQPQCRRQHLWSGSPKPKPHPGGWSQTCQPLSPLKLPLPHAPMPQSLADLTPNRRPQPDPKPLLPRGSCKTEGLNAHSQAPIHSRPERGCSLFRHHLPGVPLVTILPSHPFRLTGWPPGKHHGPWAPVPLHWLGPRAAEDKLPSLCKESGWTDFFMASHLATGFIPLFHLSPSSHGSGLHAQTWTESLPPVEPPPDFQCPAPPPASQSDTQAPSDWG